MILLVRCNRGRIREPHYYGDTKSGPSLVPIELEVGVIEAFWALPPHLGGGLVKMQLRVLEQHIEPPKHLDCSMH